MLMESFHSFTWVFPSLSCNNTRRNSWSNIPTHNNHLPSEIYVGRCWNRGWLPPSHYCLTFLLHDDIPFEAFLFITTTSRFPYYGYKSKGGFHKIRAVDPAILNDITKKPDIFEMYRKDLLAPVDIHVLDIWRYQFMLQKHCTCTLHLNFAWFKETFQVSYLKDCSDYQNLKLNFFYLS